MTTLLLGPAPFATFLYTGTLAALSAGIALVLRRPTLDGTALAYLLLIAAGDLGLFVVRGARLPTSAFLPLGVALTGLLAFGVRRVLGPGRGPRAPADPVYPAVLTVLFACVWIVRIVKPEPHADFSFYQAWTPLYLEESFRRGRFLLEDDMGFGRGFLSSGLYYAPDTLGLAALAGGLVGRGWYPAYNATSILCVLLTLGVLAAALRGCRAALIAFAFLAIVWFRLDVNYWTVLGNNWADNVLPLAGALTCYHLVRGRRPGAALLGPGWPRRSWSSGETSGHSTAP